MDRTNPPLLKGAGLSPSSQTRGCSGAPEWAGHECWPWERGPGAERGCPHGVTVALLGSLQTPACSHHPQAGLTHLLPDSGRDLNVPSPQHRIPSCRGPAALAPPTSQGPMRGKGLSCSGGGLLPAPSPSFPLLSTSPRQWVWDPIPEGFIPSVARPPPSHRCTQRHARTRARAAALPGEAVSTHHTPHHTHTHTPSATAGYRVE